MRINSFLAKCGLGSRRKVESLVLNKEICVNGDNNIALSKEIDIEKDVVIYNGKRLKIIDEKLYFMFNKPKLIITAVSDDRGRKTVLDFFDKKLNIFPIGRLDYNTEGLLLLTNDGEFCNNITHPSKKIGKTYLVKTSRIIKPKDLVKLRKGVVIDDGVLTLPAIVDNPIYDGEYFTTKIKIFEGKNRQVRKMFDSLGYKVLNLKRIAVGNLELGALKAGAYKKLTKEEMKKIFE